MEKTGNFQSDVIAVVKEKPHQYAVWYRFEGSIKLLSFRVTSTCGLKLEKCTSYPMCLGYEAKEEFQNRISNITYSMRPTSEEIGFKREDTYSMLSSPTNFFLKSV